jgi:hypothetical protein
MEVIYDFDEWEQYHNKKCNHGYTIGEVDDVIDFPKEGKLTKEQYDNITKNINETKNIFDEIDKLKK